MVDGFAINGFGGSGIVTSARRTSVFDGLTLLRCNIGTDQTGTMPRGNGGGAPGSAGVKVLPGANLVIGKTGDTPDVPPGPIPGGTISRNFGDGVQINPGAGAVLNGVIVDDNAGFGVIVNGPDSAVTVTGPESPFYPNRPRDAQLVRQGGDDRRQFRQRRRPYPGQPRQ